MLELLVSLSIIGLLAALLLPAILRSRERACTLQCKNNLRQMGLAGSNGFGGGILAAVGHSNSAASTAIPVFRCPADSGSDVVQRKDGPAWFGRSNFSGVLGDGRSRGYYGVHEINPISADGFPRFTGSGPTEVTDGLSNTLFLGEQDSEPADPLNAWTHMSGASCERPPNARSSDGKKLADGFRSVHPENGANFLLGDGSVRFISDGIDLTAYHAISTIAGGEVVGEF